jgi:archaemetzincin
MNDEIRLIPLGEIEEQLLTYLCTVLAKTFGCECRVSSPLPAPIYAFNPQRAQFAANPILQRLRPDNVERVLGVVDLDLYVPNLNFIFGLADKDGRRALIALPRLRQRFYDKPDEEALFLSRALKEAVHELGHTYGLTHCRDRRCVMAFSNSLGDTDFKSQQFCSRCTSKLQL